MKEWACSGLGSQPPENPALLLLEQFLLLLLGSTWLVPGVGRKPAGGRRHRAAGGGADEPGSLWQGFLAPALLLGAGTWEGWSPCGCCGRRILPRISKGLWYNENHTDGRNRKKAGKTMTLQQLRYIVAIAEAGTFSGAAKTLFITQPSLTKMVRELEREMGIQIFERTNKGVHLSRDGEIFLGYARQVLEQADLLESRYKKQAGGKQEFTVSTQHYSFAVNAFVDLIKQYGGDTYDFSLQETQTYTIIDDVATCAVK